MSGAATVLVPEGAPEAEWLEARACGVTASEVHAIASGGRGTHLRILEEKLNGSTFRGNAHTRRGHKREQFLIAWASEFVAPVTPNGALLAHPSHPLHMATPDGLGDGFGIEAKSHDHTWDRDDVPADHFDQMQFGMWVTGFDRWLYVWEVMGEDGQPTLEGPRHLWITRDSNRITRLAAEADAFLEWCAAGAPVADDLPPEVDDALADYATGLQLGRDAEALKKSARPIVQAFAAEHGDRLKRAGSRASLVWDVETVDVLDADAWAAAEPTTWAEYEEARQNAADATAHAEHLALAAAERFTTSQRKESLTIRANRRKAA